MKAELICILDASGSMQDKTDEVIAGFNRYIDEQKQEAGDAFVTLVLFDHRYMRKYEAVPIHAVRPLTREDYRAEGWTALNDALGQTLSEQQERILRGTKTDVTVVCVITDGQENHSSKYSTLQVRSMTQAAEARGWKFVYLGANQDSWRTAQALGVANSFTRNYDDKMKGATLNAYASASASTSALRKGESYSNAQFAGVAAAIPPMQQVVIVQPAEQKQAP